MTNRVRGRCFSGHVFFFFFWNSPGQPGRSALAQLVFVLFTEAISSREEIPAAFLVHLPHVGLLQSERREKIADCDVARLSPKLQELDRWRSSCCRT